MALNAGSIEIKLFADIARLQSDMNKANKTVDSAMGRIDKAAGLARRALGGLVGAFSLVSLAKLSDEYKKFDSQLKLSTKTLNEYAQAYANVVRISKTAQSDIGAVGVLYSRLNNNLREFNVTQAQVANVTENVALALRVNNATVQETNSVMLQLSQSFGSGRLNGQEFLAVAEGAPALLRQLANSMKVPYGALKELSAQGKITREELLRAFSDPAYLASNREMVKSVGTISSSINVLLNNLKVFIGESDKATGVANLISKSIIFLGENISTVATIAIVLLINKMRLLMTEILAGVAASRARALALEQERVMLERKAIAEAEALAVQTAATRATYGAAAAAVMFNKTANKAWVEMALVQAQVAANTTKTIGLMGTLRVAVAALGGPIGAIITVLGLAATAWTLFGSKASSELDRIYDEVKRNNEELKKTPEAIAASAPTLLEQNKVRMLKLLKEEADIKKAIKLQDSAIGFGTGNVIDDFIQKQRLLKVQREINEAKEAEALITKKNSEAQSELLIKSDERLLADKALGEQGIKWRSEELAKINETIRLIQISTATESDKKIAIDEQIKKRDQLLGVIKAEKEAAKESSQAHKEAIQQAIELAKQHQDFYEASKKARQEVIDDSDKTLNTMQAEIDKLQESIDKTKLGEEGYNAMELARLRDAAATAEQIIAQGKLNGLTGEALTYAEQYLDKMRQQVELKEKINTLSKEDETLKNDKRKAERAQQDFARENERIVTALENGIVNSIFRGFEQGKSFAENFKDILMTTFKSMILRPVVQLAIDASGLGKLAGIVNGALGGGVGGVGGFGGAGGAGTTGFGLLKQGIDALNTGVVGSIEQLGVFLSTGNGGLGDAIGGYLGANASAIASALTFSDAALKLIQGDVKGAAFSGAGAAIGTYFGGPVGGAIGSFIGSAVGGLFGGKAKTKKSSTGVSTSYKDGVFSSSNSSGIAGYNRSLGGADALTNIGEAYSKTMGSLFKAFNLSDEVLTAASMFQRASKKIRTWVYWSATFGSGGGVDLGSMGGRQSAQATINQLIETVFTRGITEGVKNSNLPASIKLLFEGMVDKTQIGNMVNTTIGLANANQALIDSFNITAEQTASVALQSGQVGDELGKVINAMIESARASRFAGDALYEFRGRLEDALGRSVYGSLKEYDNALKTIDKTTEEGIATFYDLFALRGDFMSFQNALDGLKGGVRGAIFSLVSDEQKLIMQQEDMAKVFADLGQEVPGSVQELIDLGKSIDFTTKEGLNLASIFPTLVQMFSQTKSTVDGLITSLSSLDSNRFRTLFEFTRAQAYARNGISLSSLPSYAVGTNYVPNDGLAMIHQGERIIPASDNARLTGDMTTMVNEVRQLRQEAQAQGVALATSNAKMQKIFQRWDGEGIPYFRDLEGTGVVVDVNVTNP